MVAISHKTPTTRLATAVCTLHFSNSTALPLIRSNSMKKGDVLSVARIAGIMAAKKTSELVPLCHPIAITFVGVDLEVLGQGVTELDSEVDVSTTGRIDRGLNKAVHQDEMRGEDEGEGFGRVEITATVKCDGKTGVEMEALTAASVAALTVYDMCKAVDKGMRIEGLRVVRKEGGKSGTWVEGENVD